jgi:hypothetical protein
MNKEELDKKKNKEIMERIFPKHYTKEELEKALSKQREEIIHILEGRLGKDCCCDACFSINKAISKIKEL